MSGIFIEVADHNHLDILIDKEKKFNLEILELKLKIPFTQAFYFLEAKGYNLSLPNFLEELEKRKGLEVLTFHSNLFGLDYKKIKDSKDGYEFQLFSILNVFYNRCLREGSIENYLTHIGLNGGIK